MKPREQYGRSPKSVLSDKNLTHADTRVYGVMSMHAYEGNIVSIGQRRIAELSCMDRRTVRDCLKSLATHGHISTAITKLLRRSVYVLHSSIFGADPAEGLGVEGRPVLGVISRPRIDIEERGALVSFPKRRPKPQAG